MRGGYDLWFGLYDKMPLKEKRHPLAHVHCILFMIDLGSGDKMERSGAGDDLLEFAKSEEPPSTAWAVYKKVYSAMSYVNKINSIILVECNDLWSPHYADRFGYIVDEETP